MIISQYTVTCTAFLDRTSQERPTANFVPDEIWLVTATDDPDTPFELSNNDKGVIKFTADEWNSDISVWFFINPLSN